MRYRLIESACTLLMINEQGYVGTLESVDGCTIIEWYRHSIRPLLDSPLKEVLTCPLEDLPKYLSDPSETIQEVLKQRFSGELVADDVEYWIFDWLSNNSELYRRENPLPLDSPRHLRDLYKEIDTDDGDINYGYRDDSLFKRQFN